MFGRWTSIRWIVRSVCVVSTFLLLLRFVQSLGFSTVLSLGRVAWICARSHCWGGGWKKAGPTTEFLSLLSAPVCVDVKVDSVCSPSHTAMLQRGEVLFSKGEQRNLSNCSKCVGPVWLSE